MTTSDVTESSIALQWKASAATAYYELYRDGAQIANGMRWVSTHYTDSALMSDTHFSYQVKACNRLGCSSLSAAAPTQTTARAVLAPRTSPQPIVVATNSAAVTLQWAPVSGASFYKVWRTDTLLTEQLGETLYRDSSLPANAISGLNYTVTACNSAGCSTPSTSVTAWPAYTFAGSQIALITTGFDSNFGSDFVVVQISTSTQNYSETLYDNSEYKEWGVRQGQTYTVRVATQPQNGQTCIVSPATPQTMGASKQVVSIDCRTPISLSFTKSQLTMSTDTPVARPQSVLTTNLRTGAAITVPVIYRSSNEKIAAVDPNTGEVTPLATGQVTITASANSAYHDAGGMTAVYTLTVQTNTTPAGITRLEYAQVRAQTEADSTYVLTPNRAALVRVYVQGKAGYPISNIPLMLTVSNANQHVNVPLTCPSQWPASSNTAPLYALEETCYAKLDPAIVQTGMRIDIAPTNTLLTGPRLSSAPSVAKRAHLNLTLVPLVVNGITANLPTDEEVRTVLKRVLPFASFNIQRRAAWTPNGVLHTNLNSANEWTTVLSELKLLNQNENATSTYYGFVPFISSAISSGQTYTAGIAYIGDRVALGLDTRTGNWGERYMAHEIGHSLNLQHAPCGSVTNADTYFSTTPEPWLGASKAWLDAAALYDQITDKLIDPKYASGNASGYGTDIMGYCNGTWFSTYSFSRMSDYINSNGTNSELFIAPVSSTSAFAMGGAQALTVTLVATQTNTAQDLEPVLSISGRISKNQAWLSPIALYASGKTTPSQGPYTLRIHDAKGSVITWSFETLTVDHNENEVHFFVRIPSVANITRIELLKNGVPLPLNLPQTSATASSVTAQTSPVLSGTQVNSLNERQAGWSQLQTLPEQAKISWDSANYPWLTLTHIAPSGQRTVLLLQVQGGTAQAATTNLASGGQFELVLSNGLNTTLKRLPRAQ